MHRCERLPCRGSESASCKGRHCPLCPKWYVPRFTGMQGYAHDARKVRYSMRQALDTKQDALPTDEMGECERPAFMPVMPQVSTPPRPFVLKEEPKMMSILFFSVAVISSRHMLDMAAGGTSSCTSKMHLRAGAICRIAAHA